MKQTDEMFGRFIKGMMPLRKKWQMRYTHEDGQVMLYFFHYHHVIYVYECNSCRTVYEWYEKPADERGLAAIKRTLSSDFGGAIREAARKGPDNHLARVTTQIYR